MSYVVTPEQMRAAEGQAIDAGRSETDLMLAAASGIARWMDDELFGPRIVLGLIGPGKNGGDGLLALAHLADLGWKTSALLVDRDDVSDLEELHASVSAVEILEEFPGNDAVSVILDAVYGLGGRAELPAHVAELFERVASLQREKRVTTVAVDVPSGVDALTGAASDTTPQVNFTLTIGFMKSGLLHEPAATLASEVAVIDIGLEPPAGDDIVSVATMESARKLLPRRVATAGKHDNGALLVIGGAPMYFGAPRLAAEAALKVGTGLVGLAVPRMLITTIAAQVPEAIFLPLSDNDPRRSVDDLNDALTGEDARYTAAVLGPGLGRDEPAKALLARLFGQATTTLTAPIGFGALTTDDTEPEPEHSALASVPLVLDADALNWLSEQESWPDLLANVTAVLTPHFGEMARLLGVDRDDVKADPRKHARKAAQTWGQVVVLKGGYTTVAAPDGRVAIAHRATPELATAGTGDVLSGIIGGFLAQGLDPFDASRLAVCVGALAGRFALQHRSRRSIIARNLIDELDVALSNVDWTPMWL